MKGAISMLMMIVVILVVAFILISLLLQAQGILVFGTPEEILRYAALPELTQSDSYGSAPPSPDYSGDNYDMTSTEVACGIAKSIENDFVDHGYGGRPAGMSGNLPESIGRVDPYRTLIDLGWFRIRRNPSTGGFWNFSDISGEPLANMMHSCTDTGTLLPCPTTYLDEECISNLFSGFKIGDNRLCTGTSNTKIPVAGSAGYFFGNEKCYAVSEHNNCKNTCPAGTSSEARANSDKIKVWKAPRPTVALSGNFLPEIGPPTYLMDSEIGADGFPPQQCEGSNCTPLYMWTLVWNDKKGEKVWEIYATRILETVNIGNQDMTALIKKLVDEPKLMTKRSILTTEFVSSQDVLAVVRVEGEVQVPDMNSRVLSIGQLKPEFRTVWDVRFNSTSSMTVGQFEQELSKALGKVGVLENPVDVQVVSDTTQCENVPEDVCTDSLANDIVMKKWKDVKSPVEQVGPGVATALNPDSVFSMMECSERAKDYNTVNFRTNVPLSGTLQEGHTYRVVVRWWSSTHNAAWNSASCGTGWDICVQCLEPKDEKFNVCSVADRWQHDCMGQEVIDKNANAPKGSEQFKYMREVTRYQEFRFILYDETLGGEVV